MSCRVHLFVTLVWHIGAELLPLLIGLRRMGLWANRAGKGEHKHHQEDDDDEGRYRTAKARSERKGSAVIVGAEYFAQLLDRRLGRRAAGQAQPAPPTRPQEARSGSKSDSVLIPDRSGVGRWQHDHPYHRQRLDYRDGSAKAAPRRRGGRSLGRRMNTQLLAALGQIGPAPTSGAGATDSNTAVIVAAITTFGVVLAALISVFGLRTGKRLEAIEASVGGLSSDLGDRIDTLTVRFERAIDHLGIDATVDRLGERADALYGRPSQLSRIEEAPESVEEFRRATAKAVAEVAQSLAAQSRPEKTAATRARSAKTRARSAKTAKRTPRPDGLVQKPDG